MMEQIEIYRKVFKWTVVILSATRVLKRTVIGRKNALVVGNITK